MPEQDVVERIIASCLRSDAVEKILTSHQFGPYEPLFPNMSTKMRLNAYGQKAMSRSFDIGNQFDGFRQISPHSIITFYLGHPDALSDIGMKVYIDFVNSLLATKANLAIFDQAGNQYAIDGNKEVPLRSRALVTSL